MNNYRPISCLNYDYNMIMYIGISNMIKTYVKSRFIDQNVRLIEDVIDYRTNNDTCGAIYL